MKKKAVGVLLCFALLCSMIGCGPMQGEYADVVESYSYDEATKTFKLQCVETVEGMVTEIRLVSCDGNSIELDFGSEVRKFIKKGTETQVQGQKFNVDLRKVSIVIEELADPAVLQQRIELLGQVDIRQEKVPCWGL